jgi:hypothetical protein
LEAGVRFAAGFLTALLLFQPQVRTETARETFVRTVTAEVEVPEPWNPPGVDVAEAERQGLCLWEWMRAEGMEMTLEMVWAAGEVADMAGGACYLIGGDGDE